MKLLTALFLPLVLTAPAMASTLDTCGTYQAHFADSQGNFSRQIDQYKKADGSTYYVYTVRYFAVPANPHNYEQYPVYITLNGASATFLDTIYPQELEGLVTSDGCGFAGDSHNKISPELFQSAADAEGLKAWDFSAHIDGQPVENAHFPAVRFDQAQWQ